MGIILFVFEVICFLFAIYFIIEEIVEIIALRADYFGSWWTVLDLAIITVSLCFRFCLH